MLSLSLLEIVTKSYSNHTLPSSKVDTLDTVIQDTQLLKNYGMVMAEFSLIIDELKSGMQRMTCTVDGSFGLKYPNNNDQTLFHLSKENMKRSCISGISCQLISNLCQKEINKIALGSTSEKKN